MKRSGPILLAALAAGTAYAAGPQTPSDFGTLFCEASLAGDMALIEGAQTPGLETIIADALARNAEIQAAAPDEKPPLGDGIPWRSWPDYADGCEIGTITESDGEAMVEIRYTFSGAPDATYADQLVLRAAAVAGQGWLLDDIAFIEAMTLRKSLAEAFAP